MRPISRLCLVLLGGLLTACTPTGTARHSVINHVVIVNLKDSGQTDAVIADSDRLLADIDSIDSYACGRPIDTGRSVVLDDYDLALIVGFANESDYQAYLESSEHTQFLDLWSDKIDRVRVYDIHDR